MLLLNLSIHSHSDFRFDRFTARLALALASLYVVVVALHIVQCVQVLDISIRRIALFPMFYMLCCDSKCEHVKYICTSFIPIMSVRLRFVLHMLHMNMFVYIYCVKRCIIQFFVDVYILFQRLEDMVSVAHVLIGF